MTLKPILKGLSVSAWILVLMVALLGLACSSSLDPARAVGAGGSGLGGSGGGGSGSGGSSKVELEGPIEELTPATGVPTALRAYGVTANIQAAQIVLEREGGGKSKEGEKEEDEDKISLDPRDLAPTQFVEVEFAAGTTAAEVEVRAGEAEGTLQDLVTFSPAPTVTVNRNPRTIEATFTVGGAGILCDDAFTRVKVDGQVGSCALLAQLSGSKVEVEGLVVHSFTLSLSDLKTTVPPRDVILAARVERD